MYLSHIGRRFPHEPLETSIRIAFVSISICGFIIISLYRARISASLAVKVFHHPIESLEGIIDSPYKLQVANGTSVHRMFLDAPTNSDYHGILKSEKLVPKSWGSGPDGLREMLKSMYVI